MNYAKPEFTLLSNAVGAIQNPLDKSEADVMETDFGTYVSVTAYSSDE